MSEITIRSAVASDAATILGFINDLAIYEKAEHEVKTSEDMIVSRMFAENSGIFGLICEKGEQAIGFAVYFYSYSTWLGKKGIFLEDLFVSPEHRGCGAGKALLKHLAKTAIDEDCGRFEWNVLDWNTPAIEFYESIGAKPQSEWIGYRMEGSALTEFAKSQTIYVLVIGIIGVKLSTCIQMLSVFSAIELTFSDKQLHYRCLLFIVSAVNKYLLGNVWEIRDVACLILMITKFKK